MERLLLSGAVQKILEAGRNVEVLIDRERHEMIQVVDEFVAGRPHHPHGVVHGHLVQVVTREDSVQLRGVRPQEGQERLAGQADAAGLVEDAVVGVGEVKPVQHRGDDVQETDQGVALLQHTLVRPLRQIIQCILIGFRGNGSAAIFNDRLCDTIGPGGHLIEKYTVL